MKITVPVNVDIEVDHELTTADITDALRQEASEPAGSWPRAAYMLGMALRVMKAVPPEVLATIQPAPRKLVREALEQELARYQEPGHTPVIAARNAMDALSNLERLDLMARYCRDCGCIEPEPPARHCQCGNDE